MKRNILMDCTAFHPSHSQGGVSVYMQELLPRLRKDIQFTAFYKRADEDALDACGSIISSKKIATGNELIWRDRFTRGADLQEATGVWFPTQFSGWMPALPSVVTLHDMAAFLAWKSFNWKAKLYMPLSLFSSSLHPRKIIAISESSAADLTRIFPWTKSRTIVARHGLPSDVRKRSAEIGSSRHSSDGSLSLIFLDGANQRKRLDLCLLALSRYGWDDISLKITGNPAAVESRVRATIGEIPKQIEFVGRLSRPDLLDELAASDILLYPSDFEGFGFPIIEAMAFGTSVVSFPGNAEKEVGGEFAIYADTTDSDGITRALKIAKERCRDSSEQANLMKHALSFTWDESAKVHEETFAEAFQ